LAKGHRDTGDAGTRRHFCRHCRAALGTVYFGRKSLTKRDLAQVEKHTAHLGGVREGIISLDARIKRQEESDALANKAKWVQISVSGEADADVDFPIRISGKDPNIPFRRVELFSESGNVFGSVVCTNTSNVFEYLATVPLGIFRNWRNAGTIVNMNTTRQVLRVWLLIEGHERHREVPVILTNGARPIDGNWNNQIAISRILGDV
jgi:hypothetical protein